MMFNQHVLTTVRKVYCIDYNLKANNVIGLDKSDSIRTIAIACESL